MEADIWDLEPEMPDERWGELVDPGQCLFCDGLLLRGWSTSCRCPDCMFCDQRHRPEDMLIYDDGMCCPSCAVEAV